jgi:hypothetical protein
VKQAASMKYTIASSYSRTSSVTMLKPFMPDLGRQNRDRLQSFSEPAP